jgi:hypothetical protein
MTNSGDATAGRVPRLGDWGIGATDSTVLPNLDDFNIRQRLWRSDNSVTLGTLPIGNTTVADAVLVMRPAGNQTTQLYFVPNGGPAFIRSSNAVSSWNPWWQLLVGTHAPLAPIGGNFNSNNTFGLTQTHSTAANKPVGNGHAVLTLPRSSTNFSQLAMRTESTLQYANLLQGRQISSGGGVGEWVNFFHNRNIAGIVSRSGGNPTNTSAIIERGQTGDNGFVKYADGTMICYGYVEGTVDITTASNTGAGFINTTWVQHPFPANFAHDVATLTYPVTFAASWDDNPHSIVIASTYSLGETTDLGVKWLVKLKRDTSQASSPYALNLFAVGRWSLN